MAYIPHDLGRPLEFGLIQEDSHTLDYLPQTVGLL